MHRITETYEADLPPEQRLFLRTVSQFDPRRGSLTAHILIILFAVAFVAGLAIGANV